MSITYIEAQDEIFGIANRAWTAAMVGLELTYPPRLYFPDHVVAPPDVDELYGECSFVVVTANQATLNSYRGVSLYEEVGLFALQIYAPKKKASAFRKAQLIGSAVRDAFCKASPSGEVWFRAQRVSPVTGNETKNQINVVVTCIYRTSK